MADIDLGIDAIVGKWDFRNGNICDFTLDGNVELCGQRIAILRHDLGARFMLVYLRGYFGGASEPLVLGDDGNSMQGLEGYFTREINRVSDAETSIPDADPVVGVWDLNNTNFYEFTDNGWVYCCGYRIGIWSHETGRNYHLA